MEPDSSQDPRRPRAKIRTEGVGKPPIPSGYAHKVALELSITSFELAAKTSQITPREMRSKNSRLVQSTDFSTNFLAAGVKDDFKQLVPLLHTNFIRDLALPCHLFRQIDRAPGKRLFNCLLDRLR